MPMVVANHGLLSGGAPTALHYQDSFNRTNGPLGTDWERIAAPAGSGAYDLQVVSNQASGLGWGSDWFVYRNNAAVPFTNSVQVRVTNAVVGGGIRLYLGSNNSHQVWAEGLSTALTIRTATGTYAASQPVGSGTGRGTTGTTTFNANDVFTFKRVGAVYTATYGTGTTASWTDTAAAVHPVDSSHKETLLAFYISSVSQALDDYKVDDVTS